MTLEEAITHCKQKAGECEECGKEHAQLADWLKELSAFRIRESGWISVDDRLPTYGERVLTTDGSAVFEASLSISQKWVKGGMIWWLPGAVTHWQPLPEPPKEVDNETD